MGLIHFLHKIKDKSYDKGHKIVNKQTDNNDTSTSISERAFLGGYNLVKNAGVNILVNVAEKYLLDAYLSENISHPNN